MCVTGVDIFRVANKLAMGVIISWEYLDNRRNRYEDQVSEFAKEVFFADFLNQVLLIIMGL